jgi:hypothetical protein
MSEQSQPCEPKDRYAFLRACLSVAGGVTYLASVSLSCLAIATLRGFASAALVWLCGAFITFRWFSRGDDEQVSLKHLKRGALFASAFLGIPLAMVFAFGPSTSAIIKPETLADAIVGIAMITPLAFGVGVLTAK